MLADDRAEAAGDGGERLVPSHAPAHLAARGAHLRIGGARLRIAMFGRAHMQRGPLGAQPPEIGRMLGVSAHADDLARAMRVSRVSMMTPQPTPQ